MLKQCLAKSLLVLSHFWPTNPAMISLLSRLSFTHLILHCGSFLWLVGGRDAVCSESIMGKCNLSYFEYSDNDYIPWINPGPDFTTETITMMKFQLEWTISQCEPLSLTFIRYQPTSTIINREWPQRLVNSSTSTQPRNPTNAWKRSHGKPTQRMLLHHWCGWTRY